MKTLCMELGGKRLKLFPGERPNAPLVVLNGEVDEGERVLTEIRAMSSADLALLAVEGVDWGDELTPWPGEALFRGQTGFGGHADRYLAQLTGELIPEAARALAGPPTYWALAGYSLAGLFALYAPYRSTAFARVASASGSLWYPGFAGFAEESAWLRRPDRLYLSLGDREARTRNATMRPVEDNTRRLAALWAQSGTPVKLEMNPGGHFNEPELRMARGIVWMIET